MEYFKQLKWLPILLLTGLLLASCKAAEEPSTDPSAPETSAVVEAPSQSDTPEPPTPTAAAEEGSATEELAPTALVEGPNSEPSSTAPPPATSTSVPTSEQGLTLEAEHTPEPTPFPLPDGWLGPENFGSDINPLTGEEAEDPALLQRRPIAIKISNFPVLVRPQRGLNNADLVFEHYAEGGATRFTAVFYGEDAHTVGSIRSARMIDFEIPVMYDAAFGYSGSAGALKDRFSGVDWFERIVSPDFGDGGYYRTPPEDPDVDFWHTMFTDTHRIRAILQQRGLDVTPQFQNGMLFSPEPVEGGIPAKQIELKYSGNYVTWWYDSGIGRYMRWNDGVRHNDANRDEQLNFRNIVVISALHVETDIPETEVGQGANSIEIQIWGDGPATIFRDGQRFEGQWHRNDPGNMLTFTDLDGNPLPLAPGNTWFQLVPTGFDKLYVTS